LIRASGLPYTVVRPCALADGPGAATGPKTERDLELAQGDNLRGKVARADIAALCVAALHRSEVFDSAQYAAPIASILLFYRDPNPSL